MTKISQKLNEFTDFGQNIGRNIGYFQGGGGNISCKIYQNNKIIMAIKASGSKVRDMTFIDDGISDTYTGKGWVVLEYNNLIDILKTQYVGQLTDSACVELLKNARITILKDANATYQLPDQLPSMETWFHALIPGQYVMHSHSVYINVLTCAHQGHSWFLENLQSRIVEKFALDPSKILWIDYITPGIKVATKIKNQFNIADLVMTNLSKHNESYIIFLANHGIIVSSKESPTILAIHEFINTMIKTLLCLTEFSISNCSLPKPHDINRNKILIPDLAVYSQRPQSDSFAETYASHRYVDDQIKSIGFTPRYLTINEVDELLGMESEKHREAIA